MQTLLGFSFGQPIKFERGTEPAEITRVLEAQVKELV
jgi:hypothetical protein